MNKKRLSLSQVVKNFDRKHILTIILSITLSFAAISIMGSMLYQATQDELEMRGEIDVIQSSDRFNSYLIVDKNALIVAGNDVNKMLLDGAPTDEILEYLTTQSDNLTSTLAKSFTGLYGWIRNEYLDGAGWVPDDDFVATERPWYQAAITHPQSTVFVDPYVDVQTGNVMMTIARLLDDGESVIALDIGLEGVQEITETVAANTPGGMVMVIDNNNTAITHSITSEIGKNYSEDEGSLGSLIIRTAKANNGTLEYSEPFTVNHAGKSYMVFMNHIEGGWHSISAIDTHFFYKPLIRVILFTLTLGIFALVLFLLNFYSLSQRELRNRILGIQIKAVADIYDNLLDINLTEDSFYELSNHKKAEISADKQMNAQKVLYDRTEAWVAESMKPYMKEFLDCSTLNQRLAEKSTLTAEFLDIDNIWYRGRIICAERMNDRTVTRVLWGTESIDDEKRQQEHLQHMAETDLMTGVKNRISGEYSITELLNSGKGGMFVLFDIDHFKLFNDQYGHTVGDQVIIAVANCLKNAFRANDIVMRLGGDEFAVFALGIHSREIGDKVLERFFDYINNIVLEKSVSQKICLSAGVVLCPDDNNALNFIQLYAAADKCMYDSKKIEGNHVTYDDRGSMAYTPERM